MQPSNLHPLLTRKVPSDYLPLIAQMRFFIEPEISCSRFFAEACFTEESLKKYRSSHHGSDLECSEMGNIIALHMQNGLFLDIPCGLHAAQEKGKDCDLIPLVKTMGFDSYIEVDIDSDVIRNRLPHVINVIEDGTYQRASSIGETGSREEYGMHIMTMQDDILGFLAKLETGDDHPPMTLYIAALQPDASLCKDKNAQEQIIVPYLTALYAEIDRVCTSHDLLILNSAAMLAEGVDTKTFPEADPDIALFQHGFTVLRRCMYDKVRVYTKGEC